MTTLETLRATVAHRIRIAFDGGDLVMEAPAAPPNAVLAAIKQNKAEIVAVLCAAVRPKDCSDDEWIAAVIDAARLGYGILVRKQERPC